MKGRCLLLMRVTPPSAGGANIQRLQRQRARSTNGTVIGLFTPRRFGGLFIKRRSS